MGTRGRLLGLNSWGQNQIASTSLFKLRKSSWVAVLKQKGKASTAGMTTKCSAPSHRSHVVPAPAARGRYSPSAYSEPEGNQMCHLRQQLGFQTLWDWPLTVDLGLLMFPQFWYYLVSEANHDLTMCSASQVSGGRPFFCNLEAAEKAWEWYLGTSWGLIAAGMPEWACDLLEYFSIHTVSRPCVKTHLAWLSALLHDELGHMVQ